MRWKGSGVRDEASDKLPVRVSVFIEDGLGGTDGFYYFDQRPTCHSESFSEGYRSNQKSLNPVSRENWNQLSLGRSRTDEGIAANHTPEAEVHGVRPPRREQNRANIVIGVVPHQVSRTRSRAVARGPPGSVVSVSPGSAHCKCPSNNRRPPRSVPRFLR